MSGMGKRVGMTDGPTINTRAVLNLMSKLPPESFHESLVILDKACERVHESSLIWMVDDGTPEHLAAVQEELS